MNGGFAVLRDDAYEDLARKVLAAWCRGADSTSANFIEAMPPEQRAKNLRESYALLRENVPVIERFLAQRRRALGQLSAYAKTLDPDSPLAKDIIARLPELTSDVERLEKHARIIAATPDEESAAEKLPEPALKSREKAYVVRRFFREPASSPWIGWTGIPAENYFPRAAAFEDYAKIYGRGNPRDARVAELLTAMQEARTGIKNGGLAFINGNSRIPVQLDLTLDELSDLTRAVRDVVYGRINRSRWAIWSRARWKYDAGSKTLRIEQYQSFYETAADRSRGSVSSSRTSRDDLDPAQWAEMRESILDSYRKSRGTGSP